MILVVGATGLVGSEICRLLVQKGKAVRALVRETSSPEKVQQLKNFSVETVVGDLKDKASLDAACDGVDEVITTANTMHDRMQGDTFDAVDRQGQIDLIDAAKSAGAKHFVFVSAPPMNAGLPLMEAKDAVEGHLKSSGLAYTVLKPSCFMEIWLSPMLGFDAANATARVCGSGENKLSWISYKDVSKFAVESIENSNARNAVIELGGPEAISPLEVVAKFETVTGKNFQVEHVPEEALKQQFSTATDELQKSFAGLMLFSAHGHEVDMTSVLKSFPVKLTSVDDFANNTVRGN
jgi:NADH dehydrogenase